VKSRDDKCFLNDMIQINDNECLYQEHLVFIRRTLFEVNS